MTHLVSTKSPTVTFFMLSSNGLPNTFCLLIFSRKDFFHAYFIFDSQLFSLVSIQIAYMCLCAYHICYQSWHLLPSLYDNVQFCLSTAWTHCLPAYNSNAICHTYFQTYNIYNTYVYIFTYDYVSNPS